MTPYEIRLFVGLAVKLGMKIAEVVTLMRAHDVTDAQLAEADVQNEISVYERIEQLEG